MNLTNIWQTLFGATHWFNIDISFWASMFVCLIIVILMNIVSWGIRPKVKSVDKSPDITHKKDKKRI